MSRHPFARRCFRLSRTFRNLPRPALLGVVLLAFTIAPSALADLPPLTAEEKALTEVATDKDAAAVVLFHRGELHFQDLGKHIFESKFTIQKRVKILKESAVEEYGEIDVPLYQGLRLKKLEGRTILPDGKVLPLSTQGERQISKRDNLRLKVAAFDGVAVGAILEFELVIRLESVTHLEFWFFQDRIPTLHSEMTYIVPPQMGYQPLLKEIRRGTVRQEYEENARGRILRAWASNLSAIPDEPHGFPLEDLSAQFMLLLTEYNDRGYIIPLFQNWKTTCELYQQYYKDLLRKDGSAKKKAREVAGSGSKLEQAKNLYRFVRDDIRSTVWDGHEGSADATLKEGVGDHESKAILLLKMLEAVKLDADLVWTGFRRHGRIDLNAPNPGWFTHDIVRLRIDEQSIFLDPYTPDLGFGRLAPGVEGMPAVVYNPKQPETLTLPSSHYAENLRRSELDLSVGEEGQLHGTGSLRLSGHHAWQRLEWKDTPEETEEAWIEWLEEELDSFEVEEVEVTESIPEQKVEVTWTMAQREDAVLGDEISWQPSRPFGPTRQPFDTSRRTPVLFFFADVEESEVVVRWPEGWEAEVLPTVSDVTTDTGSLRTSVEPLEEGAGIRYRRTLEIAENELTDSAEFRNIYNVFDAAEKHDAQELVLVRR